MASTMPMLRMATFPSRSVLVLAVGLLSGAWSHAALFSDDDARRAILELRQRVDAAQAAQTTLNGQTQNALKELGSVQQEGQEQLRRSLLELQSQIDALKSDLAQVRGGLEQLQREVSDLQRQNRDAAAQQKEWQVRLEERLRRLEPTLAKLEGREFMVDPVEQRDYDAAMAVLRKGDFVEAQRVLSLFLTRYPQSGYLPDVLFWLGNATYANKAYKESLAAFRQLQTVAPNSVRMPEVLLALSNVQIELKDNKSARALLQELLAKYPQSEAAQLARDRLTRLK